MLETLPEHQLCTSSPVHPCIQPFSNLLFTKCLLCARQAWHLTSVLSDSNNAQQLLILRCQDTGGNESPQLILPPCHGPVRPKISFHPGGQGGVGLTPAFQMARRFLPQVSVLGGFPPLWPPSHVSRGEPLPAEAQPARAKHRERCHQARVVNLVFN